LKRDELVQDLENPFKINLKMPKMVRRFEAGGEEALDTPDDPFVALQQLLVFKLNVEYIEPAFYRSELFELYRKQDDEAVKKVEDLINALSLDGKK
jgi:hypothetical protein